VVLPRQPLGSKPPVPKYPTDDGSFELETFTNLMKNEATDRKVKAIWKTKHAHLTSQIHYVAVGGVEGDNATVAQMTEEEAAHSIVWADGTPGPYDLGDDGLWWSSRMANEPEARPDVYGMARLYHVVARSVSECNFKLTCDNVETNHQPNGWRKSTFDNNSWCTYGTDRSEDLSAERTVVKVRQTFEQLFGSEGFELHKKLAAQFRKRMKMDTKAGLELPPTAADGKSFEIVTGESKEESQQGENTPWSMEQGGSTSEQGGSKWPQHGKAEKWSKTAASTETAGPTTDDWSSMKKLHKQLRSSGPAPTAEQLAKQNVYSQSLKVQPASEEGGDCACAKLEGPYDMAEFLTRMPKKLPRGGPWWNYLKEVYGEEPSLEWPLHRMEVFYPNLLPVTGAVAGAGMGHRPVCVGATWEAKCSGWLPHPPDHLTAKRVARSRLFIVAPTEGARLKGPSGKQAKTAPAAIIFQEGKELRTSSANGSWVEVIRERRWQEGQHNYGCWFYPVRGSGVWVNIGNTRVLNDRDHARAETTEQDFSQCSECGCYDPMCTCWEHQMPGAFQAQGVDSVQIMRSHVPEVAAGDDVSSHELILTSGPCMNSQTTKMRIGSSDCARQSAIVDREGGIGLCAPGKVALRHGFRHKLKPCACNEERSVLNCGLGEVTGVAAQQEYDSLR